RHVAGNGAIRRVDYLDVRQSMANGGGPACLRLRVQCDPADVDPRFLLDEAKIDRLESIIEVHWPESLDPGSIQSPEVVAAVVAARRGLCDALGLSELA
ncbi:MAG: N-succinylarginine dihydrolase, partial [Sphingomicrobium sp.]